MFDEIEGKQTARAIAALVVAVVFAVLAAVKVKNELRMTDMYERQAVALERIARKTDLIKSSIVEFKQQQPVAFEPARPVMRVSVEGKSVPLCYKHGFASPPVACGEAR